MSHKASPNTLDARRRILFSGSINGPLPEESDEVNEVYRSDSTDLVVYDYTSVSSLPQGYNPHYTFSFEDSDYALKMGGSSLTELNEVVEILEDQSPKGLFSRFESAGPFGRFAKQVDSFKFDYEEYLKDFKIIDENDILN